MAQRMLPCTGCHGKEGRAAATALTRASPASPPAICTTSCSTSATAGAHYALMTHLLEHALRRLPARDRRALRLAGPAYPPPQTAGAPADGSRAANLLVAPGDAAGLPACVQCHGAAMTGVAPGDPGAAGLPRDYLNAQLGAWPPARAGCTRLHGAIAPALPPEDLTAVATWLAAQPVPAKPRQTLARGRCRCSCGSVPPRSCRVPAAEPRVAAVRKAHVNRRPAHERVLVALLARLLAGAPGCWLNLRDEAPPTAAAPPFRSRHAPSRWPAAPTWCARATASAATPTAAARRLPAAAASRRRSARCTPATSRPTRRPASALAAATISGARCTTAAPRDGRLLYPAFPYPNYTRR